MKTFMYTVTNQRTGKSFDLMNTKELVDYLDNAEYDAATLAVNSEKENPAGYLAWVTRQALAQYDYAVVAMQDGVVNIECIELD